MREEGVLRKKTKKLWKDVKIGDEFVNGAIISEIHDKYIEETYKVTAKGLLFSKEPIELSSTHLLLCFIDKCKPETRKWIEGNFSNYLIPTEYDRKFVVHEEPTGECITLPSGEILSGFGTVVEEDVPVSGDLSSVKIGKKTFYWLPISIIHEIQSEHKDYGIRCNRKKLIIEYLGEKEVFCVSVKKNESESENVDKKKIVGLLDGFNLSRKLLYRHNINAFETNGLIHHNSVGLRDIIFHCMTHSDKISIALVDLKITEFSIFKGKNGDGMRGVVAVANDVKSACELLRIAREVMRKRNLEMAKLGINKIADFVPKESDYTGYISLCGRKFKDDQLIDIRLPNGEEKQVTVLELEEYLD